jgi:hypothetical protein
VLGGLGIELTEADLVGTTGVEITEVAAGGGCEVVGQRGCLVFVR